jgi:hypothetical protein
LSGIEQLAVEQRAQELADDILAYLKIEKPPTTTTVEISQHERAPGCAVRISTGSKQKIVDVLHDRWVIGGYVLTDEVLLDAIYDFVYQADKKVSWSAA